MSKKSQYRNQMNELIQQLNLDLKTEYSYSQKKGESVIHTFCLSFIHEDVIFKGCGSDQSKATAKEKAAHELMQSAYHLLDLVKRYQKGSEEAKEEEEKKEEKEMDKTVMDRLLLLEERVSALEKDKGKEKEEEEKEKEMDCCQCPYCPVGPTEKEEKEEKNVIISLWASPSELNVFDLVMMILLKSKEPLTISSIFHHQLISSTYSESDIAAVLVAGRIAGYTETVDLTAINPVWLATPYLKHKRTRFFKILNPLL